MKSDDAETMYKSKNKSIFTGLISYGNFNCVAFKNQTVTLRKPIYLGFCLLETSRDHMCKIY